MRPLWVRLRVTLGPIEPVFYGGEFCLSLLMPMLHCYLCLHLGFHPNLRVRDCVRNQPGHQVRGGLGAADCRKPELDRRKHRRGRKPELERMAVDGLAPWARASCCEISILHTELTGYQA